MSLPSYSAPAWRPDIGSASATAQSVATLRDPLAYNMYMKEIHGQMQRPTGIVPPFATPTIPTTKEQPVALPKEKRPHGLKSALILFGAALIVFKLWRHRDEIYVKLEELAAEFGSKLGLGGDDEPKA